MEDALGREVDRATFFDECHKTKDGAYVNALTEEKMVFTLLYWTNYALFDVRLHFYKTPEFGYFCLYFCYIIKNQYAYPSIFSVD